MFPRDVSMVAVYDLSLSIEIAGGAEYCLLMQPVYPRAGVAHHSAPLRTVSKRHASFVPDCCRRIHFRSPERRFKARAECYYRKN